MTSSGQREYVVVAGTANQTLSYRLRQNVTFSGCPHARPPVRQQLSVARAFALFDGHEHVLRYALAARIGPARGERQHPPASVLFLFHGWD